jgi:hypothetical protein
MTHYHPPLLSFLRQYILKLRNIVLIITLTNQVEE